MSAIRRFPARVDFRAEGGGLRTAALCGIIVAIVGPGVPAALAETSAAGELAAATMDIPQDTPQTRILDPFEPVNRGLFKIDGTLNRFFAGKGRILVTAKWIPRPLREGLYNAFDNLDEPATFANDLMQRKISRAGTSASRFAINTTIGGLGVVDVASKMHLKRTREDFGQTLGMYGITPGPYVFLPLAGPTTARDTLATLVDGMFNPLSWVRMTEIKRKSIQLARIVVQPSTIGIRQVARGAAEAGETPDEYGTVRRLYFDQRAAQIADQPNLADDPISVERSISEHKAASPPVPEAALAPVPETPAPRP